jgi:glycosyltransferase involved in cell wall biosynthesis
MNRPHLRVCHVIHSLGHGGAERMLVEMAKASPVMATTVTVVPLMVTKETDYAAQLRALDVTVAEPSVSSRWDLRAVQRTISILGTQHPDIVHTHLKHADVVGGLGAWRLGVPAISTLHQLEDSVNVLGRFKRRTGLIVRQRMVAKTIAVSDAQRRWYIDFSGVAPSQVVTVHNGITPATSHPNDARLFRAEMGVTDGGVLAVVVNVMRPGKGHDTLLDALSLLPNECPLRVAMVGDGPLRPALEDRVQHSLALRQRVSFAGWRNDIATVLAGADFVVSPTHFDSLPTALIEALAAGRPSVASDVGGVPEIVTPRCGILVPASDSHALATAIQALVADPDRRRRLGIAARLRFDQQFSAQVWAERVRALYDEVLATDPVRRRAAM